MSESLIKDEAISYSNKRKKESAVTNGVIPSEAISR
jgi:hypothetical protein